MSIKPIRIYALQNVWNNGTGINVKVGIYIYKQASILYAEQWRELRLSNMTAMRTAQVFLLSCFILY